MSDVIVVLDIGKTNVKVTALSLASGEALAVARRSNEVLTTGPYPHADVDSIWSWFKQQLAVFGQRFSVKFITCTTHGATAVLMNGDQLCLPVLDYEDASCESCTAAYSKFRPSFLETGSPDMGFGLNLGRQLFWQFSAFPEQFKKCDTILMYPQYWCWLLSGKKISEITSLGCHTDLWSPRARDFSSMVRALGWSDLFPEVAPTGCDLGVIRGELADELNLPYDCRVLNGIHDSNASLVPYLMNIKEPFTVVSTGTWVVAAAIGGTSADMDEELDMLFNVNAFGDPVACMRFMGGREWELLGATELFDEDDVAEVLANQVFAIPGFASQGGPFRHNQGHIEGEERLANARQRSALVSIYLALMTDYCLERLHSQGPIYLEGSFTQNRLLVSALQSIRPQQPVYTSNDSTGTTLGSAILLPQLGSSVTQQFLKAAPLQLADHLSIDSYRAHWREKVENLD